MLLVKQELLASLAAELEKLFPGAGDKAAFESPKVAAHGDFACTAAMQLAKPLKLNPRQVAERLRAGLLEAQPFRQWVEGIDIAVPEGTIYGILGPNLTYAHFIHPTEEILQE